MFSQTYVPSRLQEINIDFYENMNVLLEGLFQVVRRINEEKVSNDEVPIILKLDRELIGIKNYQ